MQIDSYIPVTKAKTKLLNMIRNFDNREDTIAITKNGIPKAVIMSMDQYQSICETMEIMTNKDIMLQIMSSIKDVKANKTLLDLEDTI
ncbi:MAG: type II toxin-antitoxin system Phd/YefM family antitoxin [Desulfobacula sp.]|uniref:type II toxin-antitoxin system Phd/YefM family antitoxin n=1 Tax=Desulfobacula sp. TaxID=2593537 RepID=UPI002A075949|nr:type II toxin-antitoxin system Phd/YefM family antitoxin [Chloroflexota bacterium]MBT6751457.1 type II toxin-antitoxin system Phd/YefM family antitoxin [Desulfobacula sp.]